MSCVQNGDSRKGGGSALRRETGCYIKVICEVYKRRGEPIVLHKRKSLVDGALCEVFYIRPVVKVRGVRQDQVVHCVSDDETLLWPRDRPLRYRGPWCPPEDV